MEDTRQAFPSEGINETTSTFEDRIFTVKLWKDRTLGQFPTLPCHEPAVAKNTENPVIGRGSIRRAELRH